VYWVCANMCEDIYSKLMCAMRNPCIGCIVALLPCRCHVFIGMSCHLVTATTVAWCNEWLKRFKGDRVGIQFNQHEETFSQMSQTLILHFRGAVLVEGERLDGVKKVPLM